MILFLQIWYDADASAQAAQSATLHKHPVAPTDATDPLTSLKSRQVAEWMIDHANNLGLLWGHDC